MNAHHILSSLAWMGALGIGSLNLGVVVWRRRALRAARQSVLAWFLLPTGMILLGLGGWLEQAGYPWTSALGSLLATLVLSLSIGLMGWYWAKAQGPGR